MKNLAIVLTLILLSGCKTLENYEFGDVTKSALDTAAKIVKLKVDYCAETNQLEREMLLMTIRVIDTGYDGICEP